MLAHLNPFYRKGNQFKAFPLDLRLASVTTRNQPKVLVQILL